MSASFPIFAHVWRADAVDHAVAQTVDTAYAALNAVLPGGGWPQGALVEVLQPQAGLYEWGLLAPALAAVQSAQPRQLMVLVGAPCLPFGPALGARQLNMQRMVCVHSKGPALLWATREALQCADVAAVLAWLPDARSAHLRRLQIAAHAHNKLLLVFRPLRAQAESSPAPLRLLLEGVVRDEGNLLVHVLKRRGPPLGAPLLLNTWPPRLAALLAASRERLRRQREEGAPARLPSQVALPVTSPHSPLHALLDRIAHLDHH
ncbi:translesion DNA synthesis-associated protein ImuA [Polaromonas sp.]|uniref:translesion DNA synthesis-associated protein ImuA n=1 Tax=Polaromonas sp. TaxID=1869339 RepID=UPI0035676FA2